MMYKNYISLTKEIVSNGTVQLLVGLIALIVLSFIPLFVFSESFITRILPAITSFVFMLVCYKLSHTKYV